MGYLSLLNARSHAASQMPPRVYSRNGVNALWVIPVMSCRLRLRSFISRWQKDGGAEGIRTPDPHNAIVVLYQLSYDPIQSGQFRGPN